MPSKSKAQAHLMAAAAHNPDIAKDSGIEQHVAHDFNKADEKEGNLKKGSDIPYHVSEEVELNEASGVGILKVPPSLMKQVQNYVGSVLLTMAVMKQRELLSEDKTEAAQALLNWCKHFQRKYNSSVLSAQDLKKYVNSVTILNLNPTEIFNELPENIKKNPKTIELVNNMSITMKITNQLYNRSGSSGTSGTDNELEIGIPKYSDIKHTDLNNSIELINYSMGTIQHELQHTMQHVILRNLNPNDAQTKRADNYSGDHVDDELYYAGGVEFGPQIKDLALRAQEYLEKHIDNLSGSRNYDISIAIQYAMSTLSQSKVISVLRKYKQDARANKAMKLLYREVSSFYDNELHVKDEHEFDSTEKDISKGERFDNAQEYPEAGDSLMGDLYLKIWREFGEQPEISKNSEANDPDQFTLRVHGGYDASFNIVFRHGHNDDYFLLIKPDGGEKYRIDLTKEQMENLPVQYLGSMRGIKRIQEMIEEQNTPDANLEGMLFAIQNINDSSGFFNNDSTRTVQFDDYIQDEGFFFVKMADVKAKIVCQISGKMYTIDIDNGENNYIGSEKEIEEFFTKIFDAYYNPKVEPRHINKALQYSESISDFDESLAYYVERTAKRRERGEAEVAESSMRGLADIVQNAELEHDIDDADEQELINKGVLEEMPLKFDAFSDQNPDEFVDKTAKMTSRNNMTEFSKHDSFYVLKSNNGTGYIAFDNNNNQIAIVSGQQLGKVFHEESIAAKNGKKGIVYQIYMDLIKDGKEILSDTLHSDDAIRFWQKLITNHEVYIVADGEILQRATPEKFHKYWSDEEGSPQSQFQLLLVK